MAKKYTNEKQAGINMSVSVLLLPSTLTSIKNFPSQPPPTTTIFKNKQQQQIKSMMPRLDPATTIIPSVDDEDEETIILPDDFVPRKNDGMFCSISGCSPFPHVLFALILY